MVRLVGGLTDTMGDFRTEIEWRSIHSDYLKFALRSLEESRTWSQPIDRALEVCRPAIEAVRYSYDVLVAAAEFTYHMGSGRQLRLKVPDNWLTRYVARKWSGFPLSDRLGLLAYAWTGADFWQSESQLQLFEDLKKLRDGLTHPRPSGLKSTMEILEETRNLTGVSTVGRSVGEPVVLNAGRFVNAGRTIADFSPIPEGLAWNDADQAVEIMLWHLSRIDALFFGGPSTWFAVYDHQAKEIRPAVDLLRRSTQRFAQWWG